MSRLHTALLLASALLVSAGSASAQALGTVPAQGVLYDDAGEPVEGALDVTFRLYADAERSATLWSETQAVSFVRGLFTTYLGSSSRIPMTIFVDNDQVWLGITVAGDEEMDPIPFGSVPYAGFAAYAGDAATLGGESPDDLVARAVAAGEDTYADAAHGHPFGELTEVPAGLADGDDDTLAALTCAGGAIPVRQDGTWVCGSDNDSGGTVTEVVAGAGLTGGGTGPQVTVDVDTDAVQARVNGLCGAGQFVTAINADGSVTCADDADSGGTVQTISTSGGITGGGSGPAVALAVDTETLQSRVTGTCPIGSSIRVIQEDGRVSCEPDTDSGGTVQSISTSGGLTGGGSGPSVSLGVNSSVVQTRVDDSCPSGQAIRAISSTGNVTCQEIPSDYHLRTANGPTVTGLRAGERYLVSVYGVIRNAGTGTTTLGGVRVESSSGTALAQTLSTTVNWPDGQAPASATFVVTAPSDGVINCYVDYLSSASRQSARYVSALLLPW